MPSASAQQEEWSRELFQDRMQSATDLRLPDESQSQNTTLYSEQEDTDSEGVGQDEDEGDEAAQNQAGFMQAQMRAAQQQIKDQAAKAIEQAKQRLKAKAMGNGANALESVGWSAWIVFAITYLYLMTRGAVSLFVPESNNPQDKQFIHTFFPPYRPFQEPGDFLYFLGIFILSGIIITIIITIFCVFFILMGTPTLLPTLGAGSLLSK